ncbi:hypothetical protein QWY96_17700 [Vibrio artabrorum]|uniref:Uncharacterized protein n=1 Tax=Vibrio artabrorum TaxID=446374 RepID=A0ABT8CPA9_9VIBR|nr:hypothetical protein [Vibrio artabrorum]MDN3702284.1 hypothetical protein [Vibrio artabrorum]
MDTHIEGTFSIDPAVFQDDDNQYYLYFGGIWGDNYNTGLKVNGEKNPTLQTMNPP